MVKTILNSIISIILSILFLSSAFPSNKTEQISNPKHIPLPMEKRLLGLAISDNKQVTYDQAYDSAEKMGSNFTEFSIHWDDIEKSKDQYSLQWFEIINIYYKDKPVHIGLSIGAIDMVSDRRPEYLKDMPFDAPEVAQKYNKMIESVLSKMPDVKILYVSVGNEICSHFKTNKQFEQYSVFEKQTTSFIKTIRPDILTGSKNMYHSLTRDNIKTLKELNKNKEYIFVNYYPLKSDFSFKKPSVIHDDIERLMKLYPDTKLYFTEIGYASGKNIASEELQSLFFQEMFIAWDNNKDIIPLMNIDWLLDLEKNKLDYFHTLFGKVNDNFYEYLATLGIANTDGSKKPAYYTIKKEIQKRK